MCGIFGLLNNYSTLNFENYYNLIKHRGPDNTNFVNLNDKLFVFHRLSINGLDDISNQPMYINGVYLICNGEIYNYKKLLNEYKFDYKTNSDCEIIIHLYLKFGIEKTLIMLDAEFSFMLYDTNSNNIYVARDPLGVRSLYFGKNKNGMIGFASEAKSLMFMDNIEQFLAGHWYNVIDNKYYSYYNFDYKINYKLTENEIIEKLYSLVSNSVDKRLMSDRSVCCLLSGGLDSTIVTGLVAKKMGEYKLNTYSIGLENSVDLKYARIASKYFKTNHYELIVTENEFLQAIEQTIYQIESFCTTSVRASVGHYLVSLFINKQSCGKDVVVLGGDISDEIFASYRGFQKADTPENFLKENIKLLKDVQYFDLLRSDKSISGAGLESRVPFSDKELIDFVMSIDPKLKMFNDEKMEKYLLRKAFDGFLPNELLWRRKEAFSDGVSGHNRSWFQIIKEFVNKKYTDEEYLICREKYHYMTPYDKESLYYRDIFEKYYPGRSKMIPYYWRHPFTTQLDPSARCLDFYKE